MGQAFGLGALVNGMLTLLILPASNNNTTTFVLVWLCLHFKNFGYVTMPLKPLLQLQHPAF